MFVDSDIWKRFTTNNPKVPLAYAVATGVVTRESLPREVQEHIAGMVEFFQEGEQEQDP